MKTNCLRTDLTATPCVLGVTHAAATQAVDAAAVVSHRTVTGEGTVSSVLTLWASCGGNKLQVI